MQDDVNDFFNKLYIYRCPGCILHSRRKRIVLLLTTDAFAVVRLISRIGFIVKIQLVETISEGQQHQAVYEEKLEDIEQHSAQRDLQWT